MDPFKLALGYLSIHVGHIISDYRSPTGTAITVAWSLSPHNITCSLHINTDYIAVYYSVRSQSASALLMVCNLFIIISVNIIGVSYDKHIRDTFYSSVFGYK